MKTLTPAVDTAFAAENVPILVLIDMYFDSATVHLCNAAYDFNFGVNTYLGAASVGSIEEIPETSDLSMSGIKMTLTGVDPANIAIALAEPYQGRQVDVYLAPLDTNYQIINDPSLAFRGRMDVMEIDMGKTATITLTAESRLTDWNKAAIRRYNHEDQIALHPTDRFFEYVPQMVERDILWGTPSPSVPPKS